MSVWLIVPVRSLRDGKRRLSRALDAPRRAALVEWLFLRTLEQAREFPGLSRTLVVTSCLEAQALSAARGAQVMLDAGTGLNDALALTEPVLRDFGAGRVIIVPSDLPRLLPEDLRELAAPANNTTIALAPDRRREGTNGIGLPAGCGFACSFGTNSFARHLDQVHRLGMQAAIVDRPGLAFDVDLPDHLADLQELTIYN